MLTSEETFKVLNENKENWNVDHEMFEVYSLFTALLALQEDTDPTIKSEARLSISKDKVDELNVLAYEFGEHILLNTITNKFIGEVKFFLNKLFPN
jgi:hypothetical protein